MNQRTFYFLSALGLCLLACGWFVTSVVQSQTSDNQTPRALPDFDLRNDRANYVDESQASKKLWSLQTRLSQGSVAIPNNIARRFVQTHNDAFGLSASEANALTVAREYRTEHNGVTHVTLQQTLQEAHRAIPVFEGDVTTHIARNGEVIAASGSLISRLAQTINATEPTLTAEQALRIAADYAAVTPSPLQRQTLAGKTTFKADKYERDVAPELVYFPLAAEATRLAWQMTLWLRDTPDVYLLVIDAERGSLLYRRNLTNYEQVQPSGPRGQVFTGESPRPNLPVVTTTPATVERVELPFRPTPFNGRETFTMGDPHYDWWNTKAPNDLISNNTSTYLDRDASPNQPDSPRLTVTDGLFNFPLDLSLAPTTNDYQKAAQANVFYWVNRYHDILYQFGFTEAAGNFQTDNFTFGGRGNDAVNAEVQDGSGTNNANFSTPADGGAGRMQMYLWTGNPQRDGDFDQGVVIHELTHGLSSRLIAGLGGVQGGGMGEGWSDYFGIVLLAKEGDDLDGSYAVGQYATGNYTRGIRRFPYSTNPNVYPYNYGEVKLTGVVHPTGEIWCNTLLEMRAQLIRHHGFQEGQRQSIQLVVDGMKLSPRSPSFVDARNGILLADKVNNGGANQCLLWQAFSKRGLGYQTESLSANDNFPIENFDAPPACHPTGTLTLDRKSYLSGETMRVSLGDRNATGAVRVRVTSLPSGDEETFTLTPDATFNGAFNGAVRISNSAMQKGDGIVQASLTARDKLRVSYEDADNGAGVASTITKEFSLAGENRLYEDDLEGGNRGWLPMEASSTWALTNTRAASGTTSFTDSPGANYPNNASYSLLSPRFDFSRMDGATLAFSHSYAFENLFDYGFVEASTDDGTTWRRMAAYTGTLASFTPARVSLDGLAGMPNVRLRLRVQSDPGTVGDGWFIDDIRVIGRQSDVAALPPNAAYAPVITEGVNAFGALAGGNTVRIIGANFSDSADTTVFFGARPATNVTVLGQGVLTCIAPASAQPVAVTIRLDNRFGSAQLVNGYLYYQAGGTPTAPTVSSLTPDAGSARGGTVVTVLGNNFTPETRLQFGTLAVTTPQFITSQMLRVTTPAATANGAVNVLVSQGLNLLATLPNAFTYHAPTPPTIELLSPTGGEQIFTGTTITVRWRSRDNRSLIRHRVELHSGEGTARRKVVDLATELPGSAQSFNWNVSTGLAAGTSYTLRVTALDDEGAETEAFSSNVFSLARRWQTSGAIAQSVQRPAVTSDGQNLFIFGGRTGTASGSTIGTAQRLRLDQTPPTAEPLAAMPVGLNAADAAYLNGKIYIAGGINPQVTFEQKLFVYDVTTNAWSTAAAPPDDLYLYSLVADPVRNVLYQTGGIGFDSNANSRRAWRYTPQSDRWDELPPMTTARFAHEAALINGKLYVCGGSASTEVFDFDAQRWTTLANFPAPRQYSINALAQTADGRALWLIAGGELLTSTTPLGDVMAYDLANNRWFPLDGSFGLITARSLTAGVTINNQLYAVAGFTGATNLTSVERLPLNNLAVMSQNQPPLLVTPATTLAFVGQEISFEVNGYDPMRDSALTLTAQNLPPGTFIFNIFPNNDGSVTGSVRWTPTASDANRDYTISFTISDGQLSDTRAVTLRVKNAAPLAAVNAASYRAVQVAAEQICSAFAANLGTQTSIAQTLPLPATLGGTTVTVNGLAAPLFFVSPTQINFLMPPAVGLGSAQVVIRTAQDVYSVGTVEVVPSVPAIFTNNAQGTGAAAAMATPDGATFQSAPFDITIGGRPNYLLLFATGIRRATTEFPNDTNGVAETVRATIEGQPANVLYAGAQGSLVGLDQLNIEFPASLAGRGARDVEVVVSVNGVEANRVTVRVK